MALDIHRNDNLKEWLFAINDKLFNELSDVFEKFYFKSGIQIDYYKDFGLDISIQKMLLKTIDEYLLRADLNENRQMTVDIISFRGFLLFTIGKNWDLVLYCD